jgi:hypothetical protein
MRRGFWWVVIVLGAILLVADMIMASVAAVGTHRLWTFDDDPIGEVPRGWEVGAGKWEVRLDAEGRNHVLVQTGPPLPGFDLPTVLAPIPPLRDLRASVKIKRTGAGAFETMGLVLQWQDPGTMLIVKVEGTPGRVWLERVQGGEHSLRAGYIIPLERNRWNSLRVVAQENWLNLLLNGKLLGGVRIDDPAPGRVGLMAGPGARILLDDLEIETPATGSAR